MVDFLGWEMPIQYTGILHEHQVVRQQVGIFDVSHMGRILIEGVDAERLLDYLSTNEMKNKKNGTATYTVWCDSQGKSVDDLIVYRQSATQFFVVVNAGNRQKDLEHLQHYAKNTQVQITERYREDGILAVQGPAAEEVVCRLFPAAQGVKPMHFMQTDYEGHKIVISHTGYTGAGGFEIYAPNEAIVVLWKQFLEVGKDRGIEPIGLGARDTLRLEMGYALYGHELSAEIAPIESVSAWTVKMDKPDFLGKPALEELSESGSQRFQYGVVLEDRGIAREGYGVFLAGQCIGKVTSGTQSPSLNRAVALVLVERKLQEGDSVEIQVRQNFCRGHVTKPPFYKA